MGHLYKTIKVTFLLLAFVFINSNVIANEHSSDSITSEAANIHSSNPEHANAEHATSEGFNAGEMIVEHISDAHDWHLWGEGAHSVSVPLPIIVKTDKGIELFSSSNFHHGHATYHGKNYNYRLIKNNVVIVNEDDSINETSTATLLDFSITKNVAAMMFSCIVLLWLFLSIAKAYSNTIGKAPSGKQSFLEPIIIFIRDEVGKASIGEKKYEKFMPYLLTAFFFIWINNLLGLIPLIPGGTNLTGNIAITMTLAIITLIIVSFSANKNYWGHIFAMPGVPVGVLIILTPIEILGFVLRPFVLMVRLFANITAGHIIALSFYSLIFIFGENGKNPAAGFGVSIVSIAFTVFMGMLELLVAFLQAYVFTLLSAMYIGAAVEEHHHAEHH